MPVGITLASSEQEPPLAESRINISAGGMGFLTANRYGVGDLLRVVLDLGQGSILRAQARVLHSDPLPRLPTTRRIGARFVDLPPHDEDRLVRWILRRQAEHLKDHYAV